MSAAQTTAADLDVDLRQLFASLARNWLRILVIALAVTALALALAWKATPLYKAETKLLIETRESVFTRPDSNGEADRPILDERGISSQVQLVSSNNILRKVAQKLDLASLPEFDPAANLSMLSRFLIVAGLKSDPQEIPAEDRVLAAMREKLNVYPIETSRVIVIEFSSENPKLAAAIPDAIAEAYIADQGSAKLESNAAATDWLAPEIADLSKRVKDAEAKVAAYRSQSGLLLGQNNSVLATQQLSELSSELSRVRASRASAEATAASVREALKNGGSLDALPEVLSSNLIQRLRERQVQLRNEIADLSTTLLDNHPRIRSLRSQLADLDSQIRAEAEKVLKSVTAEAKTAQAREDQLTSDLNKLKAQSAEAGEQQVELNALEREANAQRQLLESYMTRYREASSREDRNYLPVDARIFSPAVIPTEAYFPKIAPIVSAAFVASVLVMSIITLLRELFSGRAMRPAAGRPLEPVEEVVMPVVRQEPAASAPEPQPTGAEPQPASAELQSADMEPPAASVEAQAGPESLPRAMEMQVSALGEIDIARAAGKLVEAGASRAIFVSPEGDEAAASSVLVSRAVADAGLRVLLLDLTASGAASRPMLDSGLFPGITNLLASEAQFSDVIHPDRYSDCHVIPVGTADPARAMRAADRLPIIMQSLTTAYDLVVVECGPTDSHGIGRLVADGTEIFVSMIEPDEVVAQAADQLVGNGYPDITLVTPAGHDRPGTPVSGRSAA
jgi:exopolysaccharide transport family protein